MHGFEFAIDLGVECFDFSLQLVHLRKESPLELARDSGRHHSPQGQPLLDSHRPWDLKLRRSPTRQELKKASAYYAELAKPGTKVQHLYWTLGRYDSVAVLETKDERTAMESLVNYPYEIATGTLTAVPREEALKIAR